KEPDLEQSASQTPQSSGLNTDHPPSQKSPGEVGPPSIAAPFDWPTDRPQNPTEHTPGLVSEESTVTAVSSSGGAVESNIETNETNPSSSSLKTHKPRSRQKNTPSVVMAPRDHLPPPATGSVQSTTEVRSSSNASELSNASSQPDFERAFRMVIHLPNDRDAQRMTCLDTCADIDVISHEVVESLKLETESYSGGAIKPFGPITYKPERQVTLDWHVATFYKTYRTTFVVFNEEHSDEFDILLGRDTIKKIKFYKKNRGIWWSSARGEVCLSEEIGD
ncbi:MAG: hypothetical protein L6R42_002783, partial [Xanthoria sp. 1 TBL-2021]